MNVVEEAMGAKSIDYLLVLQERKTLLSFLAAKSLYTPVSFPYVGTILVLQPCWATK
jgi:hypothetical protein